MSELSPAALLTEALTPEALIARLREELLSPTPGQPAYDRAACDAMLERAIALGSVEAEAWARAARGANLLKQDALASAVSELVQARALFERLGHVEGQLISVWRAASVWSRVGALEHARHLLGEGLLWARAHAMPLYEGILLTNLAFTWGAQGDAQPYAELSAQALEIFTALGQHARRAHALCNLGGALARLSGAQAWAEAAYQEAERLVQPQAQPLLHALILGGRAELAWMAQDHDRGRALAAQAIAFLRERGMSYDAARQELLLIDGLLGAGFVQEGAQLARGCEQGAQQHGHLELRIQALLKLSQAERELGQHAQALQTMELAWQLRAQVTREEAHARFAVLRDAQTGHAIAQERLRALDLAQINERLRHALRERDQLLGQLERQAMTDPLTGALNRRGLERALARQPASAWPRVALVMDLNAFKRINDTLGHRAGDEVLVEVVRRLQAWASPGSLVGRLGGDELVWVGSGQRADASGSAALVERARAAMTREPCMTHAGSVAISVSVGACLVEAPGALWSALDRADALMYADKRA